MPPSWRAAAEPPAGVQLYPWPEIAGASALCYGRRRRTDRHSAPGSHSEAPHRDHGSPSARLNPAAARRIMVGSSPLSPLPGEAMKLNGATIPDEIVRRVVERRGTEHCFAELDPRSEERRVGKECRCGRSAGW